MKYAEMKSIDPGLKFQTPSGLVVETTGATLHVASNSLYVHEVEVAEGTDKGQKFFLNLDVAKTL